MLARNFQVRGILLNGTPTQVEGVTATTTLLDWLREHKNLKGTKEGCAEGDCGACTVVIESLDSAGKLTRRTANACILTIGQIEGLGVRTIEGLASKDGSLNPIQNAFAQGGATQCGFCTPGFVMSAYAHAINGGTKEISAIHDALAGNLCRCTGYRPIIEAIIEGMSSDQPISEPDDSHTVRLLTKLHRVRRVNIAQSSQTFFAPKTLDSALKLRKKYPDAVVLAGGTDVGVGLSRDRQHLQKIIFLGNIRKLSRISKSARGVTIGSTVTYTDALDVIVALYPNIKSYWTRIGSQQIRNLGTLGGNIGTASPIGDLLPILLALDAQICVCSSKRGLRIIPAKQYFLSYRKTALRSDEIIHSIRFPNLPSDTFFFAEKVSKRRDQDISAVCAAYFITLKNGRIEKARLAYGGVAEIPKRATEAEKTLTGKELSSDVFAAAADQLTKSINPIHDVRGSREYRLLVAKNLLHRLYLRIAQPDALLECDAL